MAVFPNIPAEMLGVLLSHHVPNTGATDDDPGELPAHSNKIDWSQLAKEAAQNADLDATEQLPSPP